VPSPSPVIKQIGLESIIPPKKIYLHNQEK